MDEKRKFIKTKSQRNKEMLLVENTYLMNIQNKFTDNLKMFNMQNIKFLTNERSFIKLNEKDGIIDFSNTHNHYTNEFKTIREEERKTLKT